LAIKCVPSESELSLKHAHFVSQAQDSMIVTRCAREEAILECRDFIWNHLTDGSAKKISPFTRIGEQGVDACCRGERKLG
jgi:hypothetical protein